MLQIATLRERPDHVVQRLAVKNLDAKALVDQILSLDEERRKIQGELDLLLNQQNTIAKQVGEFYKAGKKAEGDELKNKSISSIIQEVDKYYKENPGKMSTPVLEVVLRTCTSVCPPEAPEIGRAHV